MRDRRGARVKVDVAPSEPEHFAKPRAGRCGEGEERPIVARRLEQAGELVACEHAPLALIGAWALRAVEQPYRVVPGVAEPAASEVEDAPGDHEHAARRPCLAAIGAQLFDQASHVVNFDGVEPAPAPARQKMRAKVRLVRVERLVAVSGAEPSSWGEAQRRSPRASRPPGG